ncbi:hypothetical protein DMENIID0001_063160 [Sergentomyia squamirostris]
MLRKEKMSETIMSNEESCLFDEARNTVKNNAAFRGILLHKANEFYRNGKHLESMECQIEALCLGFRTKFFVDSQDSDLDYDFHLKLLEDLKSQHKSDKKSSFVPTLAWDKIKSLANSVPLKKEAVEKSCPNPDPRSLITRCKEFPEDWVVLQLCKNFNPNGINSLKREIITHNSGIFLTLFKYPRSDLNDNEPVCVYLPPLDENIYELLEGISKDHAENLGISEDRDKICRTTYWSNIKKLDQDYVKLVIKLQEWLGPWLALFQGRIKPTKIDHEEEIFTQVDEFAKREKLSKRQIALLIMVCSGINFLDDDEIERASQEIAEDYHQYIKIKDFLTQHDHSSHLDDDLKRSPTILIVDELLDQFPWELLFPDREITRVSSLHILMRLFDKYKNQIKDGYLQLDLQTGNSLINCKGDLMNMESRIVAFLDYWLPHWKQHVRISPSWEEMKNFLESSDVFLYCGHGNALKFIKSGDLIKSNLNCVVMLFGCDSVKLKSNGFCSEMMGCHLYYHYALCPLVIGATNIITDLPIDQLSTRVLSTWFKSKRSKHFAHYDPKSFSSGKLEFKPNSQPAWKELYSPNILEIFAKIRTTETIAVWLKASVVLRGLPVWSVTK